MKLKPLMLLMFISAGFCMNLPVMGVKETTEGYIGVFANLEVNVTNGTKRIFIDTFPLTETDTQASARLAMQVACQTLEMNCEDKDFFYSIKSNSPMIGGPSAGSAMTILTMAELLNLQVKKDIVITGTINPDSSIGLVGGIVEKAKAAEENGLKTILIPKGTMYLFENETMTIEIAEVSTIKEAFSYFTNYEFEEQSDIVNSTEFNNYMKIMCDSLFNYSNSLLTQTQQIIGNSTFNKTSEEYQTLETLYNQTLDNVEIMNELYINESYYSASSYSVRVSINLNYIISLNEYFLNQSNISQKITELNNTLNSLGSQTNQEILIDNINDYEAISIAIERVFEAKELLNTSINNYQNNETISALYNLAFCEVRTKTAESWFDLKNLFTGNKTEYFSQNDYYELSLIMIENAKTLQNYAESIYESYYTQTAYDLIDSSVESFNEKNYVYSFFESLKSISNSNLGMILSGITEENLNERIEISRVQAAQNINTVQSENFIPVLAISYYEYAQTLKEIEPLQALIFFEYSKQFAQLTYQLNNGYENNEQVITTNFLQENYSEIVISFFLGLMLVLILIEGYYEKTSHNKKRR